MVEPLTYAQFRDSPGVQDWRVAGNVASASFVTGSFAQGVIFVNVIGDIADEANHHPDVDLRYSFVEIRLTTHEIHALSERDVSLARDISAAAKELGMAAKPATVSTDPNELEP